MSLLRAPKAPDAEADMGPHSFSYVALPYTGTWQAAGVLAAAQALHSPLHQLPGTTESSGGLCPGSSIDDLQSMSCSLLCHTPAYPMIVLRCVFFAKLSRC